MNVKEKTVCFSGHRHLYESKAEIEKRLEATVRQCIAEGAESFITGGALGFDTLAAWTIIRLRDEFPHIKLVLILPCPPAAQTLKWQPTQKAEYQKIRELADEEKILADSYTGRCMLDRNDFMVDHSYKLIHYLRTESGGTYYTVNYAQNHGIKLVGI